MSEMDRLLSNSAFARLSQVDILEGENPPDACCGCIRSNVKYYAGKVVKYNTSFLMNCGWMVPCISGSIFTSWTLLYLAMSVSVTYILSKVKCADGLSVRGYGDVDCLPLPDDVTMLTLGTGALVIQAIFTISLISRWQNTRSYIAKIIAAHHSMVASLAAHIGEFIGSLRSQARANAMQACTTFLRFVNLGHSIIYIKAATSGDHTISPEQVRHEWSLMVSRGLLKPDEEPYMRIVDSPAAVFAWAILHIDKMKKAGIVDGDSLSVKQVVIHLEQIIDSCQDVITSVEHMLPYPFVQVVSIVQGVFMMQLVMVCAGMIGEAADEESMGEMNELDFRVTSGMVSGYITLVSMMLVSLSLSSLFTTLSSPMGGGVNDFPQEYYTTSLEKDTKVVFEGLYNAGQQNLHNIRKA
jgi:hypothetical protein